MNKIGIIGGMGPFAGIDLFHKIFSLTKASTDQEHLPIVLISYPNLIPDRSLYLSGKTESSPVPPLFTIIEDLVQQGVTHAGIPCVTAHNARIFGEVHQMVLEQKLPIKLISILDATIAYLKQNYPERRRIAALSTTATFENKLFIHKLTEAAFIPILQSDEQQEVVNQSIFDKNWGIKACSNPVTEKARSSLLSVVDELAKQGTEAVILGCTELPLAIQEKAYKEVVFVDPTYALAFALIEKAFPEKLKQNS